MKLSMIVAAAGNGAIGFNNGLPWKLSEDMKYFKEKTMGNVVIMGRSTYDSFKDRFPNGLPKRTNIVVTRNNVKNVWVPSQNANLHFVKTPLDAIIMASTMNSNDGLIEYLNDTPEIFIIGGKSIYEKFLVADMIDKIYYTRVNKTLEDHEYDTTLHIDFSGFDLISNEETEKCNFEVWERDRSKLI